MRTRSGNDEGEEEEEEGPNESPHDNAITFSSLLSLSPSLPLSLARAVDR